MRCLDLSADSHARYGRGAGEGPVMRELRGDEKSHELGGGAPVPMTAACSALVAEQGGTASDLHWLGELARAETWAFPSCLIALVGLRLAGQAHQCQGDALRAPERSNPEVSHARVQLLLVTLVAACTVS